MPDDETRDIDIQIISSDTAGDDDCLALVASHAGFVDGSVSLPESFPVYVNDYAYWEEGPLYEVTDAVRETISDNLSRFLGYLYDDFSPENVQYSSYDEVDYLVYYTRDDTDVSSSMNKISVLSSDHSISNDAADDELLNNEVVKAAMSYLGLTDPVVTETVEYGTDGSEYLHTYEISERADDVFRHILNRSFSSITVEKYMGDEEILVIIGDVSVDELTKYGDYPALSYTDVVAELTSYYPEMDTTDVEAEIYYSSSIEPGFFFPCYRFYIKDGTTTRSSEGTYKVVDVLLTDKSVDD